MSHNGTTPTTDENRASITIPPPLMVPVVSMYYPYGTHNTAAAQQYIAQPVYPNVVPYSLNGDHRHGAIGLSYNTLYNPFYAQAHNVLSRASHSSNPIPLMAPQSLMPPPILPQLHYSSASSSLADNRVERNKNLNIRECQSPVTDQISKAKSPLQIVDTNHNNADVKSQDSSSESSFVLHSEYDQTALASSTIVQEVESDNPQDDFLAFIEQKTKMNPKMPELNPFANEFCFVSNKTSINETPVETNEINYDTVDENHQSPSSSSSSYRLLFDNLIEKSLESIEAIKKSKKKVSVNDMSVQCEPIVDTINRSTQTLEKTNNFDLIEESSLRTVRLMEQLLLNFRNVYRSELHDQCQTMAHTCDELWHLISFTHHHISSLNNDQKKTSSIDLDNPFITTIQNLPRDMRNSNPYQASPVAHSASGRGTPRQMMQSSVSPAPSFSLRQINQTPLPRSKLCLLCHKPLDEDENDFHKLCRSLVSRPDM